MNEHLPVKQTKYIHWIFILSTLVVLASAITIVTVHLRKVIRHQIVLQDGYVLHAAAIVQQFTQDALVEEQDLFGPEETLGMLLDAAQLRDIIAVRIFAPNGRELIRFPENVTPSELSTPDLLMLQSMQPISRFRAETPLSEIFTGDLPFETDHTLPMLRAYIPLQSEGKFSGAAEIIMNGENVAAAFKNLDQDLLTYAGLIVTVGGALVAASLAWAFGRLQRSNSLLVERTQRLLKANHELTMAAKTSAIGAVTAHLIHDLKSPLFGLELFVTSRKELDKESGEDWDTALDTTRRMQKVIADVVQILQEEKGTGEYELGASELIRLLESKLSVHAGEKGVTLETKAECEAQFSNKDVNLILLILTNLGHNALQATPAGGTVRLQCLELEDQIAFHVQDTGPGIPVEAQNGLFTAGRTTKKGGTGLGLPISKQLAYHLQGELILKESSPQGTTFELRISKKILVQTPSSDRELLGV